jgi:hypothetical protein
VNEQILYSALIIAGVLITATGIRLWKQKPAVVGNPTPQNTSDANQTVTTEKNPVLPPSIQTLEDQVRWLKLGEDSE